MRTLRELKEAAPWRRKVEELKAELAFVGDLIDKLSERSEEPNADHDYITAQFGPLQATHQALSAALVEVINNRENILEAPSAEEIVELRKAVAALSKVNIKTASAKRLLQLFVKTVKDSED